jgi:hypothetical protein
MSVKVGCFTNIQFEPCALSAGNAAKVEAKMQKNLIIILQKNCKLKKFNDYEGPKLL